MVYECAARKIIGWHLVTHYLPSKRQILRPPP